LQISKRIKDTQRRQPTKIKEAKAPAPTNLFHRPKSHEVYKEGRTLSPLRMKSSSKTKGSARARANGHPTMAPVAYRRVANSVRRAFRVLDGAIEYANANVVVYMANEDGRRAADAFHIPALKKSMKKRYLPTLRLTFSRTAS
jgi:hypothetical protein